MPHRIYLGLGSNLGDRKAALDSALANLAPQVRMLQRSPIYETAPWGYTDQPDFLNQVVEAETELPPKEVLALLKATEKQLGRQPRIRNGPREIDIDILLYDDLVLDEPGLHLPHPNLHERAFVVAPLADIAPELVVPGQVQTIRELSASLDKSGIKVYAGE
ncbi:MAG: 2-amino-4-hydroxy-6-hydroxymethyldihydropteridine diphosphokinase [Anaerolineales bacterium]